MKVVYRSLGVLVLAAIVFLTTAAAAAAYFGGRTATNMTNATCYDTDGGYEIYVNGTVSGVDLNGTTYEYADYCTGNLLTENFCNGVNPAANSTECSHGYICSSGACVLDPANLTCFDSDGGLNYYVSGNVSGFGEGGYYFRQDYCGGTILMERYCNGNLSADRSYSCTYGCEGGRCLSNATGQPDLTPYQFTASTYNLTVGQWVTYTLLVKNIGNATAGPFYSKIAFNPIYAPWSGLYTSSLAPGAVSAFARSTYYSTPGWYQINATVDWKGQVTESNEANNKASFWVYVTAKKK